MKSLLSLVLISFVAIALNGQVTITITPNPSTGVIYPANVDVPAHAFVTNTSTVTKIFKWERTVNFLTTGMTSAVCDVNQCYLPQVSSHEFTLNAGQQAILDVHVYPNGYAGSADICVTVTEVANIENSASTCYLFTDGTTATANLNNISIGIYPNPSTDYFTLSGNASVINKITLFNILGKVVKSFDAGVNGQYDISEISNGIYLARLEDRNGKILRTLRLVKKVVTP